MSEIKIRRPHAMPLAKARKEAEKIAAQLKEKFALAYEWQADRIVFERQGVTGHLLVEKEAVEIEAKLGMLLSFLKPTIEGHINDNLNRVFSATTAPVAKAKPAGKTKPAK
jgi:putative polyhydroxyalkanoate system protein